MDGKEDTIESLRAELAASRAELEKAVGDNRKVSAEARDRKLENRELAGKLEAATAELEAATAEPATFKAELAAARAEIQGFKHRDSYAKIARDNGVTDPGKLADLIELSRYTPAGIDPDAAAINSAFQATVATRKWLTDPAPTAEAAPKGEPAPAPVKGPDPSKYTLAARVGADRGMTVGSSASTPDDKPIGKI